MRVALLSRTKKLYRFDSIWRFLLNPDKKSSFHINDILFIGKFFWHINTRSYLEWTLFFYGVYEEQVQQLFTQYLTPGDIALDVGSNIGIHTLFMSNLVSSKGDIISFEPHEEIYNRQINNLILNQITNVKALKIGLSNKNSSAYLQKYDCSDSSNQGTSTIVSEYTENTLKIKIARLDDLISDLLLAPKSKIKLIKVDIEGHEEAFFEGALETIKEHLPVIIFENSQNFLKNPENLVRKKLSEYQYTFLGIDFNSLHQIDLQKKDPIPFYRILALPNIALKKESA